MKPAKNIPRPSWYRLLLQTGFLFLALLRFSASLSAQKPKLPHVQISDKVPERALLKQNEKAFGMNELQKKKTISAYMASVRFKDQQVGCLLYN